MTTATDLIAARSEQTARHNATVRRHLPELTRNALFEQAAEALEAHDRTYVMSDSPEVGRRGRKEADRICALLDQLEPAQVARLAAVYDEGPIDTLIARRFARAVS